MFWIEIENLNETNVRITSNNPSVYDVLREHFSFEVPGARFMPSYKDGSWDGWIRLFHYRDKTIYKGLGKDIIKLLKSDDYGEIRYKGFEPKEDVLEQFDIILEDVIRLLPEDLVPYDYQVEVPRQACQNRRNLVLSPTSSGKSLLIYIVIRFLMSKIDEKILLIVPSISLVDQMYDDFKSYGYNGYAHLIVGGSKKNSEHQLYISTWQSLQRLPKDYYQQFGAVIVDEVHGATASSLKSSVEKCTNAVYRFGFTGTLSEFETDEIVLKGLFGPIVVATTYQEMRDLGIIPDVEIEMVRLKYGKKYEQICKAAKGDYREEVNFIYGAEARDELLLQIAQENFDKNGIFLFREIKHLERIEKLFRKHTNRPVVIINGGVGRDVRAEIRRQIDKDANEGIRGVLLLATYGTMSTGVSIKNLDYGVFAAAMKSKIKVLQSLGRLLRKSSSKVYAKLYDLWDDLSDYTNGDNFGKSHAKSRLRFYREAGFRVLERIQRIE